MKLCSPLQATPFGQQEEQNMHSQVQRHSNAANTPTILERSIADVIERESRYQDILDTHVKYHLPDRDQWVGGLDDHRFKAHCKSLLKLHAALADGDGVPCLDIRAPFRTGGPPLPAVKLKSLGMRILKCCQVHADNPHWNAAWANHVFHPAITVLLRSMKRYATRTALCHVNSSGISHDLELGTLTRHLVRFVHRVNRSWKYINAVRAYTRKEEDNFKSARHFIYHFAGKHTRLCFLRIDLTLRTAWKDFSHSEDADKAVTGFLRSLRSSACQRNLLPGYLGFIIKRENGISRGTHFHLLVVLNGDLQGLTSRSVDYISDALCEMWLRRIGHDRGSAHNSYKDRRSWPFNGLGLQDFQSIEALVGLRYALCYLTKQDCVLKTSNDTIKNFWRTPTPCGTRKKRGPKRKRQDYLSLLHHSLDGPRSPYPPGFDPTPYVLAHKRRQDAKKPRYGAWDRAPITDDRLSE